MNLLLRKSFKFSSQSTWRSYFQLLCKVISQVGQQFHPLKTIFPIRILVEGLNYHHCLIFSEVQFITVQSSREMLVFIISVFASHNSFNSIMNKCFFFTSWLKTVNGRHQLTWMLVSTVSFVNLSIDFQLRNFLFAFHFDFICKVFTHCWIKLFG